MGGVPHHKAPVLNAQLPSQLLDLLCHNNGVLLADLLSCLRLVVIRAAVHVRVPVDGTEQVPAAAVETWIGEFQRDKAELIINHQGGEVTQIGREGWLLAHSDTPFMPKKRSE